MKSLKQTHPDLSKLVAQLVYARHKEQAEREVAEIRRELAALIQSNATGAELAKVLQRADPKLTIDKQTQ